MSLRWKELRTKGLKMKPEFVLELGFVNWHYDEEMTFSVPLYYHSTNIEALDGSICFIGSIGPRGPEVHWTSLGDALNALSEENPGMFDIANLRYKDYNMQWFHFDKEFGKWIL